MWSSCSHHVCTILGSSPINSLNDCRKTTQAGLLDKYMRQEDCNPEFTISLIQRNCLYIGKLSIGLDHIRSPPKSHKLLATISTRSQCVAQSEFWRGDRNQYIACDSFPPSQAESIPILRGPGGLLVSGNITTTHSTHNALHTAHTLHYTAIATIPLIHHSLHSLQPLQTLPWDRGYHWA